MKRFLAVAGAVSMIVVAIIVRANINGSDHNRPATGRSIVCVTELAAQCNALAGVSIRIEDAAVTAKAIAAGTETADAWVTFDPWPQIASQLAKQDIARTTTRLAVTDLVIAGVGERMARLAPTCGGTVNWKCLGDDSGRPWTEVGGQAEWGTVRAGIPSPSSGQGLLLLGEAASGYFGRVDFATNDFDDAFLVWKSKVRASVASFTTFVQQFPAAFSAVGATRAEATTGAGNRPMVLIEPPPSARAVVVVASIAGRSVPGATSDLKRSLRDAGWSTDGLDGATGLPDAGVLLALSGLTG